MFLQSINGIIWLALVPISFFGIFPTLLFTWWAPLFISMTIGIFGWYIGFIQTKIMLKGLLYSPSQEYKQLYESWTAACNVDAQKIQLKYAYTGEQLTQTMFNTVIIDPTCFSTCDNDPHAAPVLHIFNVNFLPVFTPSQHARLAAYKELLTPTVQCFLFKHEVGHVVAQFSIKKLWVNFIMISITMYTGIIIAKALLMINLYLAIFAGILATFFADVFLLYFSNATFGFDSEKNADLFAAQHSTTQEIQEAAQFWIKHQQLLDEHQDQGNFFTKLPSEIRTGHPNGKTRADYLMKIAANKP